MKVSETLKAISGRKVDDGENRTRPFGGRLMYAGKPPETHEVGVMRDDVQVGAQNFDAAMRAWTQSPPATVEERLAALEQSK